ncbi:hypothetical protein ACFSUS_21750 [Spirosoma soli]|uniref:Uncharacterized protein n=1 Tax=Spirosoma soli TaxID=1770529 RepID=A0ABW5MA65_9BACT
MKALLAFLADLFGPYPPHLAPLIDESQDDTGYDPPIAKCSQPFDELLTDQNPETSHNG